MMTTRTARRRSLLAWIAVATATAVASAGSSASGQMFGERSLGGTLSRRASPGASGGSVGTLRNQRFLRGNRGRTNFVGADRNETREFVGMQQAANAGSARSAVAGLSGGGDYSLSVNQPLPRAATGRPYPPRLAIGFATSEAEINSLAAPTLQQLRELVPNLEVSVADRIATLRGVASSAEDRQLAELLVSFEPGISAVTNELQVADDREVLPTPPPLPTPDLP